VLGYFFFLSQLSLSQQLADSILTTAIRQIHENPNLAIEKAQGVFDAHTATIDLKVRALIIISTAYSSKREYEKSLETSLKAIEFLPQIDDNHLKSDLLNRIGAQYQELNVYDEALSYLDNANVLLRSLPEGVGKSRGLGFNNLVRGFIYREQMSCEIALDYFNNSIKDYQTISSQFNANSNLSIAYYNKGNCLLTLEKIDEAKESFLQAIVFAKTNNAKSLIAFANKGLASVYTLEGNNVKAINLLTEALQNSEEVGDKILNRSIYRSLANNYLAVNDLKNYSLYHNKNISIHNEIISTERKTIDRSIQNIVEENSLKVEDIKKKNYLFRAILVILIVVTTVFIIRLFLNSEKILKSLKKELKL
jgi:tetratricopeptide (TPR) repeat protein